MHGSVGFLTRYDEDLREPLVRRQGSQVSMRVARGSAAPRDSAGSGATEEGLTSRGVEDKRVVTKARRNRGGGTKEGCGTDRHTLLNIKEISSKGLRTAQGIT